MDLTRGQGQSSEVNPERPDAEILGFGNRRTLDIRASILGDGYRMSRTNLRS